MLKCGPAKFCWTTGISKFVQDEKVDKFCNFVKNAKRKMNNNYTSMPRIALANAISFLTVLNHPLFLVELIYL